MNLTVDEAQAIIDRARAHAGHRVTATTQIWPQVTELRRHVEQLGLADRATSPR